MEILIDEHGKAKNKISHNYKGELDFYKVLQSKQRRKKIMNMEKLK